MCREPILGQGALARGGGAHEDHDLQPSLSLLRLASVGTVAVGSAVGSADGSAVEGWEGARARGGLVAQRFRVETQLRQRSVRIDRRGASPSARSSEGVESVAGGVSTDRRNPDVRTARTARVARMSEAARAVGTARGARRCVPAQRVAKVDHPTA